MINDNLINKIVKESIDKVINEGFEEGTSLENLIMKLYDFGAELNLNKNAKDYSVRGIGSVIMESCRKMMEIINKKPMNAEFSNEFSKKAKEIK